MKDDCEGMRAQGFWQAILPNDQGDTSRRSTFSYHFDQLIRGVLYVYICVLPFPRLLVVERNGFIFLAALMAIWCGVNRRHFFCRTPVDLPLAAFVLWVGISVPFSASPAYSFGEFAKLLQQSLVFYLVVFFFQASRHRLRILVMFLVALIVSALYGIWRFDTSEIREYYLVQSFMGSEVALTTFIVMILPLAAAVAVYAREPWLRRLSASTVPVAVVCQLLTFSRAGLLALFVEAIAIAAIARTRLVAVLVVVMFVISLSGVGALLYVGDQSKLPFIPVKSKLTTYNLVSRFKAWELGIEKVREYPFFGMGYGKNMYQRVAQANINNDIAIPMAAGTHNTLLDITVGAGVPAGLAYLWLMWTIGRTALAQFYAAHESTRKIWSLALFLMVIGLFTRNFFDHMWVGSLAVIFWVIVGMAVRPLSPRFEP